MDGASRSPSAHQRDDRGAYSSGPLNGWKAGCTAERSIARLSVGCGAGALERQLIERGLCKQVDAFDASIASLHVAVEAARAIPGIRYFAADFNRVTFPPNAYDAVFFHQSAHHVERLEHLFMCLLPALKPGGIVYLDEYVGPSRTEWNDSVLELDRTCAGHWIRYRGPAPLRWNVAFDRAAPNSVASMKRFLMQSHASGPCSQQACLRFTR